MRWSSVVLGAAIAEAAISSVNVHFESTGCTEPLPASCLSLINDIIVDGTLPDKYTSFADRNKDCSLAASCETTLKGVLKISTTSLCTSYLGYTIPKNYLENGWKVNHKINVNENFSLCATKAYYTSTTDQGICLNPASGTKTDVTVAAGSITLAAGNPRISLVFPECGPSSTTVFTIDVAHTANRGVILDPDADRATAGFYVTAVTAALLFFALY